CVGSNRLEKNDCNFPWRSDDNRLGAHDQTTVREQESPRPAHPGKKGPPPGATATEPPRGKPLPLDKLFQERSHRPHPVVRRGYRRAGWSATAPQLLLTGHQPDKTRPCQADPEGGLTGEGFSCTTEKSQLGLALIERAQERDRPPTWPQQAEKNRTEPDKTP